MYICMLLYLMHALCIVPSSFACRLSDFCNFVFVSVNYKNNRDTYYIPPHLARFTILHELKMWYQLSFVAVNRTLIIFNFISYICSVSCLELCIALCNYCNFLCLAFNFVFKCKGICDASFLRHWPDLLNT